MQEKFNCEPIGSAGNRPQGGLCKPPARPVVMIIVLEAAGLTDQRLFAIIDIHYIRYIIYIDVIKIKEMLQ